MIDETQAFEGGNGPCRINASISLGTAGSGRDGSTNAEAHLKLADIALR